MFLNKKLKQNSDSTSFKNIMAFFLLLFLFLKETYLILDILELQTGELFDPVVGVSNVKDQMSHDMRKPVFGVPTRSDSDRAAQAQKMAKGWKLGSRK